VVRVLQYTQARSCVVERGGEADEEEEEEEDEGEEENDDDKAIFHLLFR
jgi:ribosomal protein L12E/L44/L45/RPP1/RPP2